jgi:hypothetical protein
MSRPAHGGVHGAPLLLLRLEGAVLLGAAALFYAWTGASWWMFALLFLAPDLGMLGYVAGSRMGAALYNGTHTTLAPAALAALGTGLGIPLALPLAAIWAAHIGFDRLVGYGLKYATAFGDTHLGSRGTGAATGAAEADRIGPRQRTSGA